MTMQGRKIVLASMCIWTAMGGAGVTFLVSCCAPGYKSVGPEAFNQYRIRSLQPILYGLIPFGDSIYGELFVDGQSIFVCISQANFKQADMALSEASRTRLGVIDAGYRDGWDAGRRGDTGSQGEMKIPDDIPAEQRELWQACWRHGVSRAFKLAQTQKGDAAGSGSDLREREER